MVAMRKIRQNGLVLDFVEEIFHTPSGVPMVLGHSHLLPHLHIRPGRLGVERYGTAG